MKIQIFRKSIIEPDYDIIDTKNFTINTRKELIESTGISPSSFTKENIREVITILRDWFDFNSNFNIKKYKWLEENLFINISYEKGILKFQKNPLSLLPEYSYMWDEIRITKHYFHYIFSNTYNTRNSVEE